jgi:hypothetical protein
VFFNKIPKGCDSLPPTYTKKNGTDRDGKPRFRVDSSKFLFNVDTFYYTVDAVNYDDVLTGGLLEQLEQGRSSYYESNNLDFIEIKLEKYENPTIFEINPGQRPWYGYCIRNNDFAIYFMTKRRGDDTYPIKVQIHQFKLWEQGILNAYMEAEEILYQLEFKTTNGKPNRIDLCVHSDQFQWILTDLIRMDYPRDILDTNKPHFIRLDPATGEFETVYYGDRSRLQMRVYNKSKEIKAKQKYYFNEIYGQHELNAENVWNIEFEIHRDYLKDFVDPATGERGYYDDVNNLLTEKGLSYLWTHLVFQKFYHDSSFWKVLQQGDPNRFIAMKDFLIRLKDIDSTLEREVAQIRGRLMKFALNQDTEEGSEVNAAIRLFYEKLHEYEDDKEKDFSKDLDKKRRKYQNYIINKKAFKNMAKTKKVTGTFAPATQSHS